MLFVNEYQKKLNRPVNDLEDVRMMMIALEEIREKEIDIDMELSPIEVCMCVCACVCLCVRACVRACVYA